MSASKQKRGSTYERTIEEYFVSEVIRCGGLAPKLVDQGRKGFPDRTAIWPCYAFARIHFVELKTIGGKLESWQERYHDDLRKRNAFVFVLWTKKQVDEYIRDYAPVPF
jgi:hypothetical protein